MKITDLEEARRLAVLLKELESLDHSHGIAIRVGQIDGRGTHCDLQGHPQSTNPVIRRNYDLLVQFYNEVHANLQARLRELGVEA